MLGYRALAVTVIGLVGCGLSLRRPYVGLLMLVVLYFFRPDLWGAEVYVRPVLWLTIAVTIGWQLQRRRFGFSPALRWLIALLILYTVSTICAALSTREAFGPSLHAGQADSAFVEFAGPLINIAKIFVAVFLITELCDTPRKLAGLFLAVIAGSAWFVKVSLLSWAAAGFSDTVRIDTSVGQGGGANYIAWVLATTVPLLVYKIVRAGRRERLLAGAMLPLWVVGIVATGSRGGVICLAAGLVVLLMTLRRFRLVLVLVVMSVLFLQFVPAARLERLETITLDPAKMDESMLARLQHVEIGMQIMADHPLFGTGLGSFPEVKKKYLPRGYAARDEHVAHNTLIQMGSEVGLIFLGVFVAFNFYAVWCLLRRSPEAFNGPDADHMDWVRSGLAAALAASAVQMLKGDMAMVDYFWWIYGLSVAYHMVRRKAVEASAVLPVQPSAPVVPKRSWRPWLKPARVGS